jgi:enediyne biosynthesis protein E4
LRVPQPSRGAAFGDLDNDGRIDVVVENIDGAPLVLHNDSTGTNHWITLQLIGTRSNRLAIGAKVRAVSGELSQIEEVRSGGSYLSQNDLRIHFGLSTAAKVDRVEIRWPSGTSETLQNLAPDRIYVVKEGSGIVPAEKGATPKSK